MEYSHTQADCCPLLVGGGETHSYCRENRDEGKFVPDSVKSIKMLSMAWLQMWSVQQSEDVTSGC